MLTEKELRQLDELRANVHLWLERRAEGLDAGRFTFCASGSTAPVSGHAALFATCFAVKIAWQTGAWDLWSEGRKMASVDFIRSFQDRDGAFRDPWLNASSKPTLKQYARAFLRKAARIELRERVPRNERAETRQAASTLRMVGECFKFPLPLPVKSASEVAGYTRSLGWENPWAAGSHLSHLAALQAMNHEVFGTTKAPLAYHEAIHSALSDYYIPETGTWGKGKIADWVRINGAMKVLTALEWMPSPHINFSNLLRFALKQPPCGDGCGFLNRLYVVQQAFRRISSDEREVAKEQVSSLARQSLQHALQFSSKDCAFSFNLGKAQQSYYGAVVSKGHNVGDLHGTMLMTWAIAISLDLLGEASGWRCPRP